MAEKFVQVEHGTQKLRGLIEDGKPFPRGLAQHGGVQLSGVFGRDHRLAQAGFQRLLHLEDSLPHLENIAFMQYGPSCRLTIHEDAVARFEVYGHHGVRFAPDARMTPGHQGVVDLHFTFDAAAQCQPPGIYAVPFTALSAPAQYQVEFGHQPTTPITHFVRNAPSTGLSTKPSGPGTP